MKKSSLPLFCVAMFVWLLFPHQSAAQGRTLKLTLEESTNGFGSWQSIIVTNVFTANANAFYRMKIAVETPPASVGNMITVQGGTLPQTSTLAGSAVATFQIGKYEATWDEWQEVRAWAVSNGYNDLAGVGAGSGGSHPVRQVSWYDVVKWINAKSEKEGLTPVYLRDGAPFRTGSPSTWVITMSASANGYRLPTEQEWEWAARGGVSSQGYTYSGSNNGNEVAWHVDNSIGAAVNLSLGKGTWPVGQKLANEIGLYDMSGNVFEWLNTTSARFPFRGGAWGTDLVECTVAHRGRVFLARGDDIGFRIARSIP
jgi:sulfatase modifying factor 1